MTTDRCANDGPVARHFSGEVWEVPGIKGAVAISWRKPGSQGIANPVDGDGLPSARLLPAFVVTGYTHVVRAAVTDTASRTTTPTITLHMFDCDNALTPIVFLATSRQGHALCSGSWHQNLIDSFRFTQETQQ